MASEGGDPPDKAEGVRDPEGSRDIELLLRCREIHEIAQKAALSLRPILARISEDRSVYTFKNRLKPATSIMAKVRRKRREEAEEAKLKKQSTKTSYEPDHVTDGWGCRYVTLYQNQIPTTVQAVVNALESYNEDNELQVELIEFVIYTNRPARDPLSIVDQTMSHVKGCSLLMDSKSATVKPPENRKSAYSSVHLVCALPLMIDLGEGLRQERAKFEIQIRDIFEEGWGEIQHDLIYSEKDRADAPGDSTALSAMWRPHLNALKTFVDGCSQHASIIKQNYELLERRPMPSLENQSTSDRPDDRKAILETLRDRAPLQALQAIEQAYGLMIEAQSDESP